MLTGLEASAMFNGLDLTAYATHTGNQFGFLANRMCHVYSPI